MKKFILMMALCGAGAVAKGQSLTRVSDKIYGGDQWDNVSTSCPTPDGGFLLVGMSGSGISKNKTTALGSGKWTVRLDKTGIKLWENNEAKPLSDVMPTPDGGFLHIGFANTDSVGTKIELVKTDGLGATLWTRAISGYRRQPLPRLAVSADGGILIAGTSEAAGGGDKSQASQGGKDYWALKLDGSGKKVWDQTLGGIGQDVFAALLQLPGGGLIFAGSSDSPISGDKNANSRGLNDFWMVATDASGKILWDKTFGGNEQETLAGIVTDSDGNIVLGGISESTASGEKTGNSKGGWLLKTDLAGKKIWDKSWSVTGSKHISYMAAATGGGVLMIGAPVLPQPDSQGFRTANTTVKIDPAGNELGTETLEANQPKNGQVALTPDGGCVMAVNSVFGLIKIRNNGKMDSRMNLDPIDPKTGIKVNQTFPGYWIAPSKISANNDNTYTISGTTNSATGPCFSGDCEDYWVGQIKDCVAPNVNFSFQTQGSKVFFNDLSVGYLTDTIIGTSWNFGDGTNAEQTNPVHEYAKPGVYEVILSAKTSCATRTYKNTVIVGALSALFPAKSGNQGTATITIRGAGFDASTVLKLAKGAIEISPKSIVVKSGSEIEAVFEFKGEEKGVYDLKGTVAGKAETLAAAFTLEEAVPASLALRIDGGATARAGREIAYDLVYTNKGNIDGRGFPVWLALSSDKPFEAGSSAITVSVAGANLNADSLKQSCAPASLFGAAVPANIKLFSWYLPNTAASTEGRIRFWVKAADASAVSMYAWTTPELFAAGPFSALANECAVKTVFANLPSGLTGYTPESACLLQNLEALLKPSSYKNGDVADFNLALAQALQNCKTGTPDYAKLKQLICLANGRFSETDLAADTASACPKAFGLLSKTAKKVSFINSYDPNKIEGHTSAAGSTFFKEASSFEYKIYFENLATATAAAQEVFVYDTLDLSKFDMSGFEIIGGGFADKKNYAPRGQKSYVYDFDLRPAQNLIARMTISADPAKGAVMAYFASFDPATMDLTNDAVAGFLPANDGKGSGEGWVSFRIKVKADIAHGAEIKNKAKIVFDQNPAIWTNEWKNVKDTNAPSGKASETVYTACGKAEIKWAGSDDLSGMAWYDVYKAAEGKAFEPWLKKTELASAIFFAPDGKYSFYAVAYDKAGNAQNKTAAAELSATFAPTESKVTLDPVAILLTATKGDSYKWFMGGVAIAGQTAQTLTPTLPGIYTAEVTKNACPALSAGVEVTKKVLAADVFEGGEARLWPNPGTGDFRLSLPAPAEGAIHDAQGRLIKTLSLEKGENGIDLTGSPDGLYFLRVALEGGAGGTIKMIKR